VESDETEKSGGGRVGRNETDVEANAEDMKSVSTKEFEVELADNAKSFGVLRTMSVAFIVFSW
jgi:hypothetical protein